VGTMPVEPGRRRPRRDPEADRFRRLLEAVEAGLGSRPPGEVFVRDLPPEARRLVAVRDGEPDLTQAVGVMQVVLALLVWAAARAGVDGITMADLDDDDLTAAVQLILLESVLDDLVGPGLPVPRQPAGGEHGGLIGRLLQCWAAEVPRGVPGALARALAAPLVQLPLDEAGRALQSGVLAEMVRPRPAGRRRPPGALP